MHALECNYDGIIIGAGHHGLVLGAYLAKAGLDILIVERRFKDLSLGERVTYITPRYEFGQAHSDGTALVLGRDLEQADRIFGKDNRFSGTFEAHHGLLRCVSVAPPTPVVSGEVARILSTSRAISRHVRSST